jgi:hypothetical protein
MKDNLILVRATELQKGDLIEFLRTEKGDVPFSYTVGATELYDAYSTGVANTVAVHPLIGIGWFGASLDSVYGVIR